MWKQLTFLKCQMLSLTIFHANHEWASSLRWYVSLLDLAQFSCLNRFCSVLTSWHGCLGAAVCCSKNARQFRPCASLFAFHRSEQDSLCVQGVCGGVDTLRIRYIASLSSWVSLRRSPLLRSRTCSNHAYERSG